MNRYVRGTLDVVMFLVVFFLIQYVMQLAVYAVDTWLQGGSWAEYQDMVAHGTFAMEGKLLAATSALSSLATLLLFRYTQWAPVSRAWLSTGPWAVLIWVVFLALGSILPAQWLQEEMHLSLPEGTQQLFEAIMGEPMGYMAIGILAPVAEELVFRGAILRTLLSLFGPKMHWVAIASSAIIFGAVHFNMPQFVHATLIGLLLGWMYYRTGSILPGLVFHWINNTVAFVMFHIMPQMADGKLIDLFHGDSRTMWMGLGFSLCIFLPALLQVAQRMKRAA